jgi:hypothetical protein
VGSLVVPLQSAYEVYLVPCCQQGVFGSAPRVHISLGYDFLPVIRGLLVIKAYPVKIPQRSIEDLMSSVEIQPVL